MNRHMITQRVALMSMLALLLGSSLLRPADIKAQAMSDYTATPPFVSNAVPPNVLLLMDNSGSMNGLAYPAAFVPTQTYNGLFVAEECYSYASGKFSPDSAANPTTMPAGGWNCSGNASYPWSGNLLNYAAQRRIDIVKYVMVGGMCTVARVNDTCATVKGQDSFNSSACCRNQIQSVTVAQATDRMPSALIPGSGSVYFHMVGSVSTLRGKFCVKPNNTPPTSDTNCGASNLFGIVADHPETTTGVIQQMGTKARVGLMEFKGVGEGGKVLADVGSGVSSLVTAVETTTPSTWTPLAESLYEATRYFAQIAPAYTSSDYSYTVTNRDPYYYLAPQWAGTSAYVNCCKSFVIIFTDGEPTQDLNVPPSMQDKAHAVHGAHCTGATTTTPCTPHKTNYANNGSHYLDDVAYYAHTTDLRQGTLPQINLNDSNATGKDLQGMQNLTIYTFYAFGQAIGREILQSAAKAGGFEDMDQPSQPGYGLPDKVQEWDKYNNTTGASGSDGIPDTYFESADADDLRDRLLATIASILQKSSSGTALSVLATSSNGDGAVYQSFFYPSKLETSTLSDIKWTGHTHALFIDTFGNLREDTNQDGILTLKDDLIIRTKYDSVAGEVRVSKLTDTNEDGAPEITVDTNGDTILDCSPSPGVCDKKLSDILPIWEAGRRLALMQPKDRKILTWVDVDGDGIVDSTEELDLNSTHTVYPDNSSTLAPYLRPGGAPYTTANIINFVRGDQIAGLRDRQLTVKNDSGSNVLATWKLGDIIHSTPTLVASPRERYDVLYGDVSYSKYYQTHKSRRQVVYSGANDGMLHAFNGGFYHPGDDPSTTSVKEHGWFTNSPTSDNRGQKLGDELWGFVPYQLLPQLLWLTRADYTHVYYVDLKPKVTDVRIFCDTSAGSTPPSSCIDGQSGASHPNGWGTILIGGMRMGGSCRGVTSPTVPTCVSGTGAPPMAVTADFDNNAGTPDTTRYFYSAYFVLDVTDPEKPPKLLWSFTDETLGLTTSYPAVLRVKDDTTSIKTDTSGAKWFAVFGSGPTGYDGSVVQGAKLYAIDLINGPGANNSGVTKFSVGSWNSWMGDIALFDKDSDYRVDAAYAGRVIHDGALPWRGKMYRLTTGDPTATPTPLGFGKATNPAKWGVGQRPTEILDTFAAGTRETGPVASAPGLVLDDSGKVWLFFGTGRYYGATDKTSTEQQYFFGIKDSVLSGACTQSSTSSCWDDDLVDVTNAKVCVVGTGDCGQSGGTDQVTGISGVTTFSGTGTTSMIGLVQSKDGWYIRLTDPATPPTPLERVLYSPTVFGGVVFFPTFVPVNDICSPSGKSNLYALFYQTGTAPQEPVMGTEASTGTNLNVTKKISNWDEGVSSPLSLQVGSANSSNSAGGNPDHQRICRNTSTGAAGCIGVDTNDKPWSRYISWINRHL